MTTLEVSSRSLIGRLRSDVAQGRNSYEAIVRHALKVSESAAAQHVLRRRYADAAILAAQHADRCAALGISMPAIAGLPVTIKDLFDVANEPTPAGSLVCAHGPLAQADALAVERLRRHGMAVIGRTQMSEFAYSGVGINPHHGTPRNPLDMQSHRIPGGSSSGAAVSVRLGVAVAALGSDTGGSIRIPAALCGLTGFKSTQSRVPRAGVFELSRTLDTVCALATGVEDCLLMDAAIADRPLAVRRRSFAGLRLLVPQTLLLDDMDDAVARAFERAIEQLSREGAAITFAPLAPLAELASLNAQGGFAAPEAYASHKDRLALREHQYDPRVAARIRTGAGVTAADYIRLHDSRRDWIRRTSEQLAEFDAAIYPTVPILAPELEPLLNSNELFFKINTLLLRNNSWVNFLDGCAFSLPCGAVSGLSVGISISSWSGNDAALASIALAIESALEPLSAQKRAGSID